MIEEVDPQLMTLAAVVLPVLVAFLTKARASDLVRTVVFVALVAAFTGLSFLGDKDPETFTQIMELAGKILVIGHVSYKMIKPFFRLSNLNDVVAPRFGVA